MWPNVVRLPPSKALRSKPDLLTCLPNLLPEKPLDIVLRQNFLPSTSSQKARTTRARPRKFPSILLNGLAGFVFRTQRAECVQLLFGHVLRQYQFDSHMQVATALGFTRLRYTPAAQPERPTALCPSRNL
jgi:hypothetical protein